MAFGRAPNRCVPRTQSGKAIGAPNGECLAQFRQFGSDFALVSALISDSGRNFRRTDRDRGGWLWGNLLGITPNDWINYLASFGAILLTFLAGTEIDAG